MHNDHIDIEGNTALNLKQGNMSLEESVLKVTLKFEKQGEAVIYCL